MVVLYLLYDLRDKIHHVIALLQSSWISCYKWWTTYGARRHGPWCCAGDDGDRARALEMEIKGTKMKRPYHITI